MSTELERMALRAARDAWEDLNATFFRRRLRRPVLAFLDGLGQLGRWSSAERTLWLSRDLMVRHGWGVVIEVLKHEMAHQWVDEVLGLSSEPALAMLSSGLFAPGMSTPFFVHW